MKKENFYNIDGDPPEVIWYVPNDSVVMPAAYCKEHLIPFNIFPKDSKYAKWITCPHDNKTHVLRNRHDLHQGYVRNMLNRENLRDFKIVRIDAEGNRVIAKERYDKDPQYFIETKLSDTSKGLEIMILVGKKDSKGKKVQLFVVPPSQRLSFDISNKDFHPAGLFTEVRAIFKDSELVVSDKDNKNKKATG